MEPLEEVLFEAGALPQNKRKLKNDKHPKLIYDGYTYHWEGFLKDNRTANYR